MGSLMAVIKHLWTALSATLSSSVMYTGHRNSSTFDFMISEMGLGKAVRRSK